LRPRLGRELTQALFEGAAHVVGRGRRPPIQDASATPVRDREPALTGQRPIGIRHGVEVHAQVDAEPSDGRQDIAGSHDPFDEKGAKLVDDLAVRWG